jgi:predicted alpha/beta superfamily hydrolase
MRRLALLLFSAALMAQPALAQGAEESSGAGYVVPETEGWDIESRQGEIYRIHVSRPPGEPPAGGYPVLYVLDANAVFAGFAEARRIQSAYPTGADKMIIVGVGYPGGKLYDSRRVGDFTPPIQNPALAAYHRNDPQGRRATFADFLLDELRPEVARRYSVHPDRQSLYGHSLGGLFALHMLYARPDAFHTITAASASLWWDDQMILAEESAFRAALRSASPPRHVARLLLLVGEAEEAPVTVLDNTALATRLHALSADGLRSRFMVLEEEGHLGVPHGALTTTLRWANQWP